jgi:hypothetical protein
MSRLTRSRRLGLGPILRALSHSAPRSAGSVLLAGAVIAVGISVSPVGLIGRSRM